MCVFYISIEAKKLTQRSMIYLSDWYNVGAALSILLTLIVKMYLTDQLSRRRGPKSGLRNRIFLNFTTWTCKILQRFEINALLFHVYQTEKTWEFRISVNIRHIQDSKSLKYLLPSSNCRKYRHHTANDLICSYDEMISFARMTKPYFNTLYCNSIIEKTKFYTSEKESNTNCECCHELT